MEGVDRAERSQSGKVWLVGAGCGGPELITVKGLSLVESCDVLLYDSLSAKELLERARPDCEGSMWESGMAGRPSLRRRSTACWFKRPEKGKGWSA